MQNAKIGEIFKERGMTLRVEQARMRDCDKCAFYGSKCSTTQNCTPVFREDGEYVIFKEVEDAGN